MQLKYIIKVKMFLLTAFEDIELKKPFKIRKSINIFSDKIELKIPALELINYI